MKATVLALLVGLLTGCATPRYPTLIGKPDPSIDAAPALTVPIGLIADTQFHESRGVASRFLGLGADEVVDVTIRTGQQVIGAEEILAKALQLVDSLPLVIHAGDAIDVSCRTEWDRFKRVMNRSPSSSSWLFVPGNHDGYLTGNILAQKGDRYHDGYWANLCNAGQMWDRSGKPRHTYIAKPALIREYVSWLGGGFSSDASSRSCDQSGALCWSAYAPDERPWESFLVQLVRLPSAPNADFAVYALMLDSSDYLEKPSITSPAGVWGSISETQLRAASELTQTLPPDAKFFFITHHPARAWREEKWSPPRLAAWHSLLKDARSLRFLVSSHTHTGYLQEHASVLGGFMELNTGSLADAPVYLRTLQFRGKAGERVGVRSDAIPVSVDRHRCGQLLPFAQTSERDYDVETQRSESDRAGERSPGLVAFGSAIRYFFNFWESKHKELRPQLLAYADVVEATMPADTRLEYDWIPTSTGIEREVLYGARGVAEALRKRANCSPYRECSVQSKGNLLLELERYYSDPKTPELVRAKAHEMRLCLAVSAANDSARGQSEVRKLYHYIAKPWSLWLPPTSVD